MMRKNKKRENAVIGILILSAIMLVGLLIVHSIKTNKERTEEPNRTQEYTEDAATKESKSEAIAEKTTEEIESTSEVTHEEQVGYIIIGDSHAVVADGQGYAIQGSMVEGVIYNQNLFIVHTGLDPVMGTLEWLQKDGTNRIREIMEEHTEITDWNIISIHGTSMVTMPDIENSYIENYEMWITETFCNSNVYIVSVPPLDEEEWVVKHPDFLPRYNQDIIEFNEKIKEAFPDQYFDYYDWFLEHNEFQDEIHYTGETYRMMFDEIIQKIQNK